MTEPNEEQREFARAILDNYSVHETASRVAALSRRIAARDAQSEARVRELEAERDTIAKHRDNLAETLESAAKIALEKGLEVKRLTALVADANEALRVLADSFRKSRMVRGDTAAQAVEMTMRALASAQPAAPKFGDPDCDHYAYPWVFDRGTRWVLCGGCRSVMLDEKLQAVNAEPEPTTPAGQAGEERKPGQCWKIPPCGLCNPCRGLEQPPESTGQAEEEP